MVEHLESYVTVLEASGLYRVTRRFECPGRYAADEDVEKLKGVFLDVETTGMIPSRDSIIELSMVPFEFSRDGRIFEVHGSFTALNDPGRSLDPFITSLTGITDEMVSGRRIEASEVERFLDGVSLVVAHNAGFDRPFFDAMFPGLDDLPWACSLEEVPWRLLGVAGRKLEYLAYHCGVFYDGHRAEVDCQVGIHVLAQDWGDGGPAFRHLLQSARRTTFRVWALESPFHLKGVLKERGYRFDGASKVWFRDVEEEGLASEKDWLAEEIYAARLASGPVRLELERFTARQRYRSGLSARTTAWLRPDEAAVSS